MPLSVRPARPDDFDRVLPLLRRGFGEQLPADAWRHCLFEYPGAEKQPNVGFILEADGQAVGFLGGIYSDRTLNGRPARLCNLSAWYIDPEHRSGSLKLLAAILAQPGITFTNLTPSGGVIAVMKAFGFQSLETRKFLWGPGLYRYLIAAKLKVRRGLGAVRKMMRLAEFVAEIPIQLVVDLTGGKSSTAAREAGDCRLYAGREAVRPRLSAADRQLLDDHEGCGHFLVEHEGDYTFVVTARRTLFLGTRSLIPFRVSDVLHLSAFKPAGRCWQVLCRLIAAHDGSSAVTASGRFFRDETPPECLALSHATYFKPSADVTAEDVDYLYSEIAFIPEPLVVSALDGRPADVG